MFHFFIGTKAQYIKTAPVIRLMDKREIPYNLIDSGQHANISQDLRKELQVRSPDVYLRKGSDLASIPHVLLWLLKNLFLATFYPGRIFEKIFKNKNGICIIHGDTPTTLLSAYLAKRAGLKVAHLEAGLRSYDYLNPFPEEIIRVIVMKLSDVLFAPGDWAYRNMERMKLRGEKCNLKVNTNFEALVFSLQQNSSLSLNNEHYCLVSVHRVETLHNKERMKKIIELVFKISSERKVVFVIHPPTELRLKKYNLYSRLEECKDITLLPLIPHKDFIHLLKNADFVVTDGGSVQEETFYLNVPCLLMRKKTERLDGIGANVYLSEFDEGKIDYFLNNWKSFASAETKKNISPSEKIVDYLKKYQ